jgi:hypothetical protein
MAVFAQLNGYVAINSVDLSDHVRSFELNMESNSVDTTAMGDTWATEIGGTKSAGLNIEWYNDHAASETDVTLFPLLGTVVSFEVRSDAGAVSTTNPSYSGSVHVNGHSMGGTHGDAAMITVTYPTSGTVTRATS